MNTQRDKIYTSFQASAWTPSLTSQNYSTILSPWHRFVHNWPSFPLMLLASPHLICMRMGNGDQWFIFTFLPSCVDDFIQNFVLCNHVLWLKLWLCSAHHWLVWFRMGFWWSSSFNKAISPGASNVITTNVTLNMFVQFICMFLCASDCWLS